MDGITETGYILRHPDLLSFHANVFSLVSLYFCALMGLVSFCVRPTAALRAVCVVAYGLQAATSATVVYWSVVHDGVVPLNYVAPTVLLIILALSNVAGPEACLSVLPYKLERPSTTGLIV